MRRASPARHDRLVVTVSGRSLLLGTATLDRPTLLADEGLSNHLLARLDDLKSSVGDRSLLETVRGVTAV